MSEIPDSPSAVRVDRRTLVTAAAWTVPVVATVVASPFSAASACVASTVFAAPGPRRFGRDDIDGRTTTWRVPAGVTRIEYEVLGGSGGGRDAVNFGGAGTLVTGELTVVPGTVLTLVVGQGGYTTQLAESQTTNDDNLGGQGHGPGGDCGPGAPGLVQGGSGGGGSAIRVSTFPVVIAGGGGGGGAVVTFPSAAQTTWTPISTGATTPGTGAANGAAANNFEVAWTAPSSVTNRTIQANGGDSAAGLERGAGGAIPTAHQQVGASVYPGFRQASDGANGGDAALTTGAGGGSAGAVKYAATPGNSISGNDFRDLSGNVMNATPGGVSGGGGGGGYAGGGGGSAHVGLWTRGGPSNRSAGIVGVGAGGGSGSSYVTPGAIGGVAPVADTYMTAPGDNSNSTLGVRVPGRIIIRYCPPRN